ncbi:MAG: hypothetical protein JNL43_15410 [Flavobacteriales bacterium]|nr:hypothetical protein [Flavobacteriales bacterium]
MANISLLTFIFLSFATLDVQGQCDYEYRKIDPLTNKTEFKTELKRIVGVTHLKGVAKIAYCKAAFAKSSRGEELTLEVKYTNTYKQSMLFQTNVDSLSVKFDDGSICALQLTVVPSSVILSSQVKTTVTWTLSYALTERFKEIARAGRKVVFMRIRTSKFNTDIDTMDEDLGAIFRECWQEDAK